MVLVAAKADHLVSVFVIVPAEAARGLFALVLELLIIGPSGSLCRRQCINQPIALDSTPPVSRFQLIKRRDNQSEHEEAAELASPRK